MSTDVAELVLDAKARCGEGPLWDFRRARLLFTDIPKNSAYSFDPATREKGTVHEGVNVSGIALNRDRSLVFGGAAGLHVCGADGTCRSLIVEHDRDALVINDILAAPHGRLYAGTVYWGNEMERHGKLYLIDPSGDVRVVDEGIELANGLALSPDNRTLYFADSAARRIYAYDVDEQTGSLSRKRTFAAFTVEDGIPDGLATDIHGFIYCAMWYGSQVVRLDPQGRVERRIHVPAIQASSVALGGKSLTELFITTAGEAWPSRLAPALFRADAPNMGGALYRVRVEIPGRHEFECAFA
jgi:D-xylono/L-arabinono-1,4-lactonase